MSIYGHIVWEFRFSSPRNLIWRPWDQQEPSLEPDFEGHGTRNSPWKLIFVDFWWFMGQKMHSLRGKLDIWAKKMRKMDGKWRRNGGLIGEGERVPPDKSAGGIGFHSAELSAGLKRRETTKILIGSDGWKRRGGGAPFPFRRRRRKIANFGGQKWKKRWYLCK